MRGVAGPAIDEAVKARLPGAEYQRYLTDPQRPMLHLLLRQAAAAGHEVTEALDQVTQQGYQGARSIAAVLHGRVERSHAGWQEPEISQPEAAAELEIEP